MTASLPSDESTTQRREIDSVHILNQIKQNSIEEKKAQNAEQEQREAQRAVQDQKKAQIAVREQRQV